MIVASPFLTEGNAASSAGINVLRSASLLERERRTTTAILKRGRFCWWGRLESTVRKTSNSCSANARSFPFLIEAQPICGAVRASCPMSSQASRRSRHSSSKTFTSSGGDQFDSGFFEDRHGQFTADRGKPIKKLIQCLSTFEVIKNIFDRNPRPGETRRTPKNLRIRDNEL